MSLLKKIIFFALFSTCCITCGWANTSFTVKKIHVEGLQRVTVATFLSYVPVKTGDRFSPSDTGKVINALYRTGFFANVSVFRKGDELVIRVVERPVIGSIHISGNKKIGTKQLEEVLKKID